MVWVCVGGLRFRFGVQGGKRWFAYFGEVWSWVSLRRIFLSLFLCFGLGDALAFGCEWFV